jgi:hypothetical protein
MRWSFMPSIGEMGKAEGKERSYRHTVKLVKEYLTPKEPRPEFFSRMMEYCHALETERAKPARAHGALSGRRGWIVGGIFSALSLLGMASYFLARRHTRRKAALA